MKTLADRECAACQGNVAALKPDQIKELHAELVQGWRVVNQHRLEKEFEFEDFRQALAFTNRVGELAEEVGHHPDIYLAWGKVKITLWTHKVDGLTESDFILAAKIQQLHGGHLREPAPVESSATV